jgi:hypothetical protein
MSLSTINHQQSAESNCRLSKRWVLTDFLDIVPETAEAILKKPTEAAEQYLGRVADSHGGG